MSVFEGFLCGFLDIFDFYILCDFSTERHSSNGLSLRQAQLKLLDTDEGARRLGKVPLVPHGSRISKSNLWFYNTLFDENAACHVAIGQCYSKCFKNGDKPTTDEEVQRGGKSSMIHDDWFRVHEH